MPQQVDGSRCYEIIPIIKLLIKKKVIVFEDFEISGKLLYTKNIS